MSFISMIAAKYNISKSDLEELYAKSNESYTLTKGAQELIEAENIEVYNEIACGDDKRITLKQVRAYLKGSAPAASEAPKAKKATKSPKTVTTSKGFQVTPQAKKMILAEGLDFEKMPCADNLKIRISDVRQYIEDQEQALSESEEELEDIPEEIEEIVEKIVEEIEESEETEEAAYSGNGILSSGPSDSEDSDSDEDTDEEFDQNSDAEE